MVTDHKPLVKILGDKPLDEIKNPRLFRLKQRVGMWSFDIMHIRAMVFRTSTQKLCYLQRFGYFMMYRK